MIFMKKEMRSIQKIPPSGFSKETARKWRTYSSGRHEKHSYIKTCKAGKNERLQESQRREISTGCSISGAKAGAQAGKSLGKTIQSVVQAVAANPAVWIALLLIILVAAIVGAIGAVVGSGGAANESQDGTYQAQVSGKTESFRETCLGITVKNKELMIMWILCLCRD